MWDHWDHLKKPFALGMVIPYQTSWAFTFRDATGQDYTNRIVTYKTAAEAKRKMREFVARENQVGTSPGA